MQALSRTDTSPLIPRLAIIDDTEFDQMLYARLIGRTGHVGETLSFFSAEEALAHFGGPDARPVDVILLDINMPGMSGFDFLERISGTDTERFADAVIVMLTTSLNPSDIQRASSYDLVKDYIHKPLEERHFTRIAELLADSRGSRGSV